MGVEPGSEAIPKRTEDGPQSDVKRLETDDCEAFKPIGNSKVDAIWTEGGRKEAPHAASTNTTLAQWDCVGRAEVVFAVKLCDELTESEKKRLLTILQGSDE